MLCRHGGVYQRLSTCLKHKLLHHDSSKYDGYRLTTLGYDFLAIHTLTMRGVITSVGRQIGVGKESDLFEVGASHLLSPAPTRTVVFGDCSSYAARRSNLVLQTAPWFDALRVHGHCTSTVAEILECQKKSAYQEARIFFSTISCCAPEDHSWMQVAAEDGTVMALKLHRLGRTSFRAVKSKRDYLRKGNHYSWLYLSRLAAIKEFSFMKALGKRKLPVPDAIDQNRHAVVMELVQGDQLAQVCIASSSARKLSSIVLTVCPQ